MDYQGELMLSRPSQSDEAGEWVKIIQETVDYQFAKLFRVIRARLRHRRFDGRMSDPITRINFQRGDSVGVLLYDPQDDTVILVRQFRYPVYASLDPDQRKGQGARQAWLLETVAGVQDEGLTVVQVAGKELLEEAGYRVKGKLRPIATFYVSPGGTSERITLFLGEVNHRKHAGQGGGVVAEGEDIQIVALPFRKAMRMVSRGEIRDAKTIIALQHLALHRGARRTASRHAAGPA
jgi:ADP-ribose pyrophosphatase